MHRIHAADPQDVLRHQRSTNQGIAGSDDRQLIASLRTDGSPASLDGGPGIARTMIAAITPAGTISDAAAFVGWLDQQAAVDKNRKIGTTGYCMGGPMVMRTVASIPERVGAGGSFHGGGLATAAPTSPHLLVPQMKAKAVLIAVAQNDDKQDTTVKEKVKAAFDAKSIIAEEVAALLGGRAGSLVDGEIIAGDGAKITLQDPATGDALLEYNSAGPALVAQAASGAARAQGIWQGLSGAERGRRLWAMAPLLRQAAESLARLESAQTGKPLRDARAEVARVAEMAEYWAVSRGAFGSVLWSDG